MKAGNTARATNSPQQFSINHLFGDRYELSHAENIHEVEVADYHSGAKKPETHTEYEYDFYLEAATVSGYDEMVSALVALKYTPGDEIALMRKGIADSENEEYAAYLAYVAGCKAAARNYYEVE